MESRRLKTLQTNIESLGSNEHGVILEMLRNGGIHCDRNTNGFFCDLGALDDPLLERIEDFVRYSIDNNEQLDVHDRCMHDTLLLLQRVPPASSTESSKQKKYAPRETVKMDFGFANKGAKLAFHRRASDATSRKKHVDDAIVHPDAPVFLYGQRS
jgi:hypothetical protein